MVTEEDLTPTLDNAIIPDAGTKNIRVPCSTRKTQENNSDSVYSGVSPCVISGGSADLRVAASWVTKIKDFLKKSIRVRATPPVYYSAL